MTRNVLENMGQNNESHLDHDNACNYTRNDKDFRNSNVVDSFKSLLIT